MLTADEIAALQETAETILPDVCQIRRITQTADGYGGTTDGTVSTVNTTCRLAPIGRGAASEVAERLGLSDAAQVALPVSSDVRVADRLLIRSVTWYIEALLPVTAWSTVRRVVVSRRQ